MTREICVITNLGGKKMFVGSKEECAKAAHRIAKANKAAYYVLWELLPRGRIEKLSIVSYLETRCSFSVNKITMVDRVRYA